MYVCVHVFVAQECEHRVRETHFFVFDLLELAPMPVREGGGGLLARGARREALALPAAMRLIFPESARRKLHYWYGRKLALGGAYHERADLVCSNSPHEIKATTGATRTAGLCRMHSAELFTHRQEILKSLRPRSHCGILPHQKRFQNFLASPGRRKETPSGVRGSACSQWRDSCCS